MDAIYYSTAKAIKRVFFDDSSNKTILLENGHDIKLKYDSTMERLIYYSETSLFTIKLNGTDAKTLTNLTNVFIERFTVDHARNKVYFISNHSRNIHSIDLKTKNLTQLNVTLGDVQDLDSDNG